ncbi:MAG: hypothetical protein GY937_19345 [bacterium]|nr:hypothetical protein [bacterium]
MSTNTLAKQADNKAIDDMIKTLPVQAMKTPLTVPIIASFLIKGFNHRMIAETLNCSRPWVSQFIKDNAESLAPLVDNDSGIAAVKHKHAANVAVDKLIEYLPESKPKDIYTLSVISAMQTDKGRLLSNKSTANISIDDITASRADIQAKRAALKYKLDKLKRVPVKVVDSVSSV